MRVRILAVMIFATLGLRTNAPAQISPAFTAATITPNLSGASGMTFGCHGLDTDKSNVMAQFGEATLKKAKIVSPVVGSCSAVNASLKMLLAYAYDLNVSPDRVNDRVLFGPAWAPTARFDINAKAPAPVSEAELRAMLKTLLMNRFKLQVRFESNDEDGYVLHAGPKGAELSPPTNGNSGGALSVRLHPMVLHWMRMSDFADFLSSRLRKPVIDETRISGIYDIRLPLNTSGSNAGADEALLLAMQQIGFELVPQTISKLTLIIDDAEKPTNVTGVIAGPPPLNSSRPVVRLSTPRPPAANAARAAASTSSSCKLEVPAQSQTQQDTLISQATAAESGSVNLQSVLSAASQYVSRYEAQLGNVIGGEVYVQDARWNGVAVPVRERQRRTEADFAILKVGGAWVGVREVTCVDGQAIKKNAEDFQTVAANAPAAVLRQAMDRLEKESASYNIGDIVRNTNLPTFALRILYPNSIPRFKFEKIGEAVVSGSNAWAIRFQEIVAPTMIHDLDGFDEFANGTFWIESSTGRVLRTELNLVQSGSRSFRARTEVSFEYNSNLGMLAPSVMQEHYEADGVHFIDCRADYLNFRHFQVETRFNFGPPQRR